MKPKFKVLLIVLLAGVAVSGYFILDVENKGVFQGRIFDQGEQEPVEGERLLPDLVATVEVSPPEDGKEDIIINASFQNDGDGPVLSTESFNYTIYINDNNILDNEDFYNILEPGEAFNFAYPAPRRIYQYPDKGVVRFVVDSKNGVPESDENNNEAIVEYNFE